MLLIILGNIFCALALLSDSVSATRKTHKEIMLVQTLSQLFYIASNVTLKGYSALAQNVVAIFRNLFSIKEQRSKVLEWVLVAAAVVLGLVFNNRGLLGILPVVGNLEYSIAVFKFSSKEKALKICFLINTVLFIIFNACILNFVGAIGCLVVAVTTMMYLVRIGKAPAGQDSEET